MYQQRHTGRIWVYKWHLKAALSEMTKPNSPLGRPWWKDWCTRLPCVITWCEVCSLELFALNLTHWTFPKAKRLGFIPARATEQRPWYTVSAMNAFRLVWINLQGNGVNWIQSLSKRLKVDFLLVVILSRDQSDLYPASNVSVLSEGDPAAPGHGMQAPYIDKRESKGIGSQNFPCKPIFKICEQLSVVTLWKIHETYSVLLKST